MDVYSRSAKLTPIRLVHSEQLTTESSGILPEPYFRLAISIFVVGKNLQLKRG
jgi:hypothetical protein